MKMQTRPQVNMMRAIHFVAEKWEATSEPGISKIR